jgi:hypothetical protein
MDQNQRPNKPTRELKEGGINENRDAGNEGQEGSGKQAGEQEVNQELDYSEKM